MQPWTAEAMPDPNPPAPLQAAQSNLSQAAPPARRVTGVTRAIALTRATHMLMY